MATLRMYRFRYSPDGEHWVQARYRLQPAEIRTRYPIHELLDVELRYVPDDPFANSASRLPPGLRT
jgi:hypothetical protein